MQSTFYQKNYQMGVLGDFVPNADVANPMSLYWYDASQDASLTLERTIGSAAYAKFLATIPEHATYREFYHLFHAENMRQRERTQERASNEPMDDSKAEELADIVLGLHDQTHAAEPIPVEFDLQPAEAHALGLNWE